MERRSLHLFLEERQQQGQLNEKFGDGFVFPEDILAEILVRLSVKNLLRLRCVCKSWRALITNIHFIKRHYQFQYSICEKDGDIPSICWGPQIDVNDSNLCVCLVSKKIGDDAPLSLTADLVRDSATSFANAPVLFGYGLFVGVVNGVVCFIWGYHNLSLWNPATHNFRAITPWLNHIARPFCLNLIGFGFDCITNDFKIVRGNFRDDRTVSYELYSLTPNSWKGLRAPSPSANMLKCFLPGAYLNSVSYWLVDNNFESIAILSFDFSAEVFKVFDPPDNAIGSKIGYKYDHLIKLYKDRLAFVVNSTDLEKEQCNFDVWVATEFSSSSGIPLSSWQHMLTIGPFSSSDILMLDSFRMDDEVTFTVRCPSIEEETSVYNLSTRTFKSLGFCICMFFKYVESLFPLSNRLV